MPAVATHRGSRRWSVWDHDHLFNSSCCGGCGAGHHSGCCVILKDKVLVFVTFGIHLVRWCSINHHRLLLLLLLASLLWVRCAVAPAALLPLEAVCCLHNLLL